MESIRHRSRRRHLSHRHEAIRAGAGLSLTTFSYGERWIGRLDNHAHRVFPGNDYAASTAWTRFRGASTACRRSCQGLGSAIDPSPPGAHLRARVPSSLRRPRVVPTATPDVGHSFLRLDNVRRCPPHLGSATAAFAGVGSTGATEGNALTRSRPWSLKSGDA